MIDPFVRFLGLTVALLPGLPILLYVVARGRGHGNWEFVGIGLFFGASVAFLAAGVGIVADAGVGSIANPHGWGFARALLVAAIPEETAKLLPLVFVLMRHDGCRRPADVMIAAVSIGLGFAALENLFYLMDEEAWVGIGWLRASTAIPAHAMFAIVMGYFAAISSAAPHHRAFKIFVGWSVAILFHTAYDFPLFAMEAPQSVNPTTQQNSESFAIGYFGFFVLVILCLAALGFRLLTNLLASAGNGRMDLRRRTDRLLNRGATWMVLGGIMAGAGVGLVTLFPLLFDGASRWLAIPYTLFPAFFAVSMFRFGRRLPPAGAT